VLTTSLDFETTLASLAALIVPTLAGLCVVDVVDEGGRSAASELPTQTRRRKQRSSPGGPGRTLVLVRSRPRHSPRTRCRVGGCPAPQARKKSGRRPRLEVGPEVSKYENLFTFRLQPARNLRSESSAGIGFEEQVIRACSTGRNCFHGSDSNRLQGGPVARMVGPAQTNRLH